jgi:hypothetical protein
VFLSAGADDPDATATARAMARVLVSRGVPVGLLIDPPRFGHTWREARVEIPYALAFAAAHLGGTGRLLPPAGGGGRTAPLGVLAGLPARTVVALPPRR